MIAPIFHNCDFFGIVKLYSDEVRHWSKTEIKKFENIGLLLGLILTANEKIENYEHLTFNLIQSLTTSIEFRDPYTSGHMNRVGELCNLVSYQMKFNSAERTNLYRVAIIHDIGKIGIKESILNQQTKLTDEQYEIIKLHPTIGESILKNGSVNNEILTVIRHHHERWDGFGYPDGLKEEKIPIGSRIVSVCDAFDAMTTNRPYRYCMTVDQAMTELTKFSGSQFDPLVVDVFQDAYLKALNKTKL